MTNEQVARLTSNIVTKLGELRAQHARQRKMYEDAVERDAPVAVLGSLCETMVRTEREIYTIERLCDGVEFIAAP